MARTKKPTSTPSESSRAHEHDHGGSYMNPGGDHDARPEPSRELVERTEQRTPRSADEINEATASDEEV